MRALAAWGRFGGWLLVLVPAVGRGQATDGGRSGPVAPGQEFMVPMRDGVRLATSIYLPETGGPWPAILSRTPYNKAGTGRRAGRYTSAGYVYVIQDCRGRFASEGVYEPYQTDMEDGHDTVEWIAAQPWSDGKVGLTGRSAGGIAANLAAAADPPHLVCAYVVTAPESLFDESYFMGGVFREHFRGNFMRLQGVAEQIPSLQRRVVMDEQWRRTDLVHHRDRTNVPIYQVGGWYDMFAKGAINNFVVLQEHGREGARGRQKLWMGPWGHSALDGDLEYVGERGLARAFEEEMRWFDYWLKGEPNGIMEEPPIVYYHMAAARRGAFSGKGGLRRAERWPPPGQDARYYLQPGGGLSRIRPTVPVSASTYRFDPADPAPTHGGANYNNFPRESPITVGPVDQRAIGERPDYLRFQTEPLTEDLTIQGRVEAELWVSTDAPDTDFMVKLVDVYPDGYEALVLDSALRTRYRHGREAGDVRLMNPGRPERIAIDLWSTSLTIEAGHRVAVHVTSSNWPRFEVNPNTGEAPGSAAIPPRPAWNTVHHDAARSSAIVLPATAWPEPE